MMKHWKTLSQNDYNIIWDKFYKDFSFKPSINPESFPSIKTDKPIMKFSISKLFGKTYNEEITKDFVQKGIDAFVEITNKGEYIIALEWQSECFYIDPRQLIPETMLDDESSSSIVSFIPDGDYYIFITKDFENIWFGHPWEKTITIIGNKLIDAFKSNKPLFLMN